MIVDAALAIKIQDSRGNIAYPIKAVNILKVGIINNKYAYLRLDVIYVK